MNRFAAVAAIAIAIALGAIGYAIGVNNQETALNDAQKTEIEQMLSAAMPPAPEEAEPVATAVASSEGLSEAQRTEVADLIRSHLIANPEIIAEAIDALQAKQEQAERDAQIAAITDNAETIFASTHQMVLGNPEGDVTLVEFFDYNCGFCRRAMADIQRLIDADPELRVVLKEFPVLGESSLEAAQVSVALSQTAPEKFEEFHYALLSEQGQITGERALATAEDLGLDVDALRDLAASDTVMDTINEVYEIANTLNLTGTPTFITRDEVVVGAVGYDALRGRIDDIRAN